MTTTPQYRFPFELVKPQLETIESRIRKQAKSFDPAVEGYVAYICNTSGKRIRPALSVLGGGATGEVTDAHIQLGVILELIHLATLVHDDIMDGADMRREMPTACARWGNSLSVLLGDCLFAHALELATEFDEVAISRKIARAANEVCTGEILQTQRQFDFKMSVEDYFEIIRMKTAALFSVALEVAAMLNGQSEAVQTGLKRYGEILGTVYQIYDDCIDLVGDEKVIGKTLGTDLAKGKLTLPILNLISRATESQREKLNRMLIQQEPIDVSVLAGIADYEGAIEDAIQTGRRMLAEAREELRVACGGNPYSNALEQVSFYLEDLLMKCKS
ncbi:MAG: octaprenyl-diphosphate synthase [Verrucomicrobiales bacterium]|jgi:octaprenyl-diphosphate synthase